MWHYPAPVGFYTRDSGGLLRDHGVSSLAVVMIVVMEVIAMVILMRCADDWILTYLC